MTDQEVVFEKDSLTLGFFLKKDIDKNESENILKEANNPACQMLINGNKKEQEDSKSNGWNVVKKRNNRKTNLKKREKKNDPKTLAKFAKIPCRNYPDCKWKKECWYLHKDEGLSTKLNRCENEKLTYLDAKVKNLSHQKNGEKGEVSRRKITAKKRENNEDNGCDEEKKSIENHVKKAFPCQNINGVNETNDVNMCSDGDYTPNKTKLNGQKDNTKRENKPPKCVKLVRKILLIEKANKYILKHSVVKLSKKKEKKEPPTTNNYKNTLQKKKSNYNCKFYKNRICFNPVCKKKVNSGDL